VRKRKRLNQTTDRGSLDKSELLELNFVHRIDHHHNYFHTPTQNLANSLKCLWSDLRKSACHCLMERSLLQRRCIRELSPYYYQHIPGVQLLQNSFDILPSHSARCSRRELRKHNLVIPFISFDRAALQIACILRSGWSRQNSKAENQACTI
jgi:hypothetical protein